MNSILNITYTQIGSQIHVDCLLQIQIFHRFSELLPRDIIMFFSGPQACGTSQCVTFIVHVCLYSHFPFPVIVITTWTTAKKNQR